MTTETPSANGNPAFPAPWPRMTRRVIGRAARPWTCGGYARAELFLRVGREVGKDGRYHPHQRGSPIIGAVNQCTVLV
jgi:hypothetical protein